VDFYGKMSSVQLPVQFRYSYPSNRVRPFVNAGGLVSFNFDTEDFLYTADIYNHVIEIRDAIETSMIKTTMLGYTVGAGAAVQLRPRNWVFLEVRYSGYYALNSADAMNISDIQLTASISF
jgi:opacity protein-like surface antigen